MRRVSFFCPFLGFLLLSSIAWAARTAVVDVDGTTLYRGPRTTSGSLMTLKKGTKVSASNYSTEGFFKVRIPDGALGWVKADTLVLGPMPDLTPKKKKRDSEQESSAEPVLEVH